MQLWHNKNKPEQRDNLRVFNIIMGEFKDVFFTWPNALTAPWHVQARINGHVLDFWPHLLKGRMDGKPAKVGRQWLRQMILTAKSSDPELDDTLIE